MDKNIETTAPKPAGIPEKDAPEAFREMAEKGTTQAKETYDKIDAATTEAVAVIEISYLKAVKGMQEYNNRIIEFAHANTNAAFDFVQKLSGVKSPTAFVELWTEHARKQLAALGQKVTRTTDEPLKTGVVNPFKWSTSH